MTATFSTTTMHNHYITIDGQEYPTEYAGVVWIDPKLEVAEDGTHTLIYAVQDETGIDFEWGDVQFVEPNDFDEVEGMTNVFAVEKYEHGMVSYSLVAEQVGYPDRRWDVGFAGFIVIPEDYTEPREAAAAWLEEYTNWCNGEVYGIATERFTVLEGEDVAFPSAHESDRESVWGFIGSEATEKLIAEGGY